MEQIEVTQAELLPVEQADRDSVAGAFDEMETPFTAKRIRTGQMDDHPVVRAFVHYRHRLNSQPPSSPVDVDLVERGQAIRSILCEHFDPPGPDEVDWAEIARAAIVTMPDERKLIGWQPIGTAPRDGTIILAWCVHPYANEAGDDDYRAPVVTHWIDHNGGGWTWHGMCGQFTHWMPLPPPPERGEHISATVEAG